MARLLAVSGLPGVPVIDGEEIIGIVTELDLIAREADVEVPTPVPFLDAIFMLDAGRDFEEEMRHVLRGNRARPDDESSFQHQTERHPPATGDVDGRSARQSGASSDDDLRLVGIVARADIVRVLAKLESGGSDSTPDRVDVPTASRTSTWWIPRLLDLVWRQPGRSTRAIVDLDAVTANVAAIRDLIGKEVCLLAVVKANAYGHGAIAVAQAALSSGATMLGVATVDEGVQLRSAGIDAPILALGRSTSLRSRSQLAEPSSCRSAISRSPARSQLLPSSSVCQVRRPCT